MDIVEESLLGLLTKTQASPTTLEHVADRPTHPPERREELRVHREVRERWQHLRYRALLTVINPALETHASSMP